MQDKLRVMNKLTIYKGDLAKIDNPSAHKASGKLCVCVVMHVYLF